MICGIDEAGRGPVIGPLVVCGAWIGRTRKRRLEELGVTDSKAFGSSAAARLRRAELAEEIRRLAGGVVLLTVDAAEVDRRVARGELNLLEQELARVIIEAGPSARKIVADGARLFGPLHTDYPTLEARDRADVTCTAVAAASILAKVERDRRFSEIVSPLEQELGPIRGGGYANKGTEAFLRAHVKRYGALPGEVRQTWSWSVLEQLGGGPARQQSLFDE